MVSPVLTLKTAGEERNNACSPQLPMPYHPDSLYPRYTPNGQVSGTPFVLRPHRPGDMGWVIRAHGELYWREYGWDERFEALVAHIAAEFIEKFDPQAERCWIAERDGERVGSVFLVRKSATIAKLRLLIVEPKARGLGLGKHLVAECLRFAQACGYRQVTLWTQENLLAARHIYQEAGFTLSGRESHAMFGVPLVGETHVRKLQA